METSQLSMNLSRTMQLVRPRVVYTNKQSQLRLIYTSVYRVRCEWVFIYRQIVGFPLLVLRFRVMRRPHVVERAKKFHFFCAYTFSERKNVCCWFFQNASECWFNLNASYTSDTSLLLQQIIVSQVLAADWTDCFVKLICLQDIISSINNN